LLVGGAALAVTVLVRSKPAQALPFTFRYTDSCCNYTYSGTCNARPNHPDTRCQAGHLGVGFDPDFFCSDGCIGNNGDCLPDIPTGSVQDIPNGQDDDCDGVVDSQFQGQVIDTTILDESCCHFRYRASCDARPNSTDPMCKAGRLSAGDNPDLVFGCGCVVDPNACIPDIESSQLSELPNGRDDDCDGFVDDEQCDGIDNDHDGMVDEDLGSCMLKFLFVPYCWNGTQAQFASAVEAELNTFTNATGIQACARNIGRTLVDVSQVNVPCPTSDGDPVCWKQVNTKADQTRNLVTAAGFNPDDFSEIIALTNQNICGNIEGVTSNGGFLWAQTGGVVMTHEIGHSRGLSDEYCSQLAGSNPDDCGQSPSSINFLGSDLGCDPNDGPIFFNCCNDCDSHSPCCDGNEFQTGRCIMSFSNADDPRGFCPRCAAWLTNPPNPRSPDNPNGNLPLNCSFAHIGVQQIFALEYAVTSDGRPIHEFSSVRQGRGAIAGANTQGNYATDIRDANGTLLFHTAYHLGFLPAEISNGPPVTTVRADRVDQALRAAVPATVTASSKLIVQISKNGTPTGQTTIRGTAPTVQLAPQTLECVANAATTVLQGTVSDADGDSLGYSWTATGGGVTIASPTTASTPATFPLGTRNVQLSVTDGFFTQTANASVTVADTKGPVVTPPPDITITGCNAPNIGTATAFDACSQTSFPVTSNKPSRFPLGVTVVTYTAVDSRGNVGTATQRVTANLADDVSCCPPGTNIIRGTSNNDVLNGTSGSDCILGFGAQDTINGNGGDDFISGGEGDDVIDGGSGNDRIYGGNGQDQLRGGIGNDFIDGGGGDDRCFGGDGDDVLRGGQGQDQLFGEAGNDQLFGDDGTDRLEGGDGNDLLDGGPGPGDVCIGGLGTDTLAPTCESATQ